MNIYEMLRKLVMSATMPQVEVEDCLKLIEELERMNAFGTIASIKVGKHAFKPWKNHKCGICGEDEGKHE